MTRVHIVVRHIKKEDHRINMSVFFDKHLAKQAAEELDKQFPADKKIWHVIEKYDVVDSYTDNPAADR